MDVIPKMHRQVATNKISRIQSKKPDPIQLYNHETKN